MGAALDNIFTSRVVGALFALAFGAWGIALNSVADRFLTSQDQARAVLKLLLLAVRKLGA